VLVEIGRRRFLSTSQTLAQDTLLNKYLEEEQVLFGLPVLH